MVRKAIVWFILIIGIVVFFYPIIGNLVSTKEHHSVISKHNKALKEMTEKEKKREREKAEKYNTTLDEQSMPISDPFASDAVTEDTGDYYDVLDLGETMGSIEIPTLDVNLPIYHGVSEDVLQQGVGHMSNSSFPIGGLNTHTALTGHRGLPSSKLFRNLDKLVVGDKFYMNVLGEELVYQVDDIKIVLPSETGWLEMEKDKDYVTLITCEPYMINTHRLLVRGERIEEDEINESEIMEASANVKSQKNKNVLSILLLVFSGAMIIILTILLIRKQSRKKL